MNQQQGRESQYAITVTQAWVEQFVVGLNLCPFAAPVLKAGDLHIKLCSETTLELMLSAVIEELETLQAVGEAQRPTSLLVFDKGLQAFNDYWSFVDLAEGILGELGMEGVIQLASFHPDYRFAGEEVNGISHYTNRSPYPMLHFIREVQLERALHSVENPETIPQNNIARLESMGRADIEVLRNRIIQSLNQTES